MTRSAAARHWAGAVCLLPFLLDAATMAAHAQGRQPTAGEVTAIRTCAKKYETDLDAAERECLFNLVGTPCTEKPEGQSNVGMTDCYRLEDAIWDDLLNENYKSLAADLDEEQKTKLREMQRVWIAYRDSTCGFYYTKIRGTMAQPMGAACAARETARRALLLKFFSGL
jgi:uncharacterized protein YecT (DUF1311 family)